MLVKVLIVFKKVLTRQWINLTYYLKGNCQSQHFKKTTKKDFKIYNHRQEIYEKEKDGWADSKSLSNFFCYTSKLVIPSQNTVMFL